MTTKLYLSFVLTSVFIKYHISRVTLLKGFLDSYGFIWLWSLQGLLHDIFKACIHCILLLIPFLVQKFMM